MKAKLAKIIGAIDRFVNYFIRPEVTLTATRASALSQKLCKLIGGEVIVPAAYLPDQRSTAETANA